MSRPTTMKVDGTVYWAIFTYTDAGVLVDADADPTVAVRKNDGSTADLVTVTKRAATTGIYDCEHAPSGEVDGDTFGYEETATVSAQAYVNRWSLEVRAAAGAGGGDATAANQTTIIANIAALNDFDPAVDVVANVGTVAVNSDMRGTDGANTVAPDNASITAILADTNELQVNQGQWVTATGFNTVAPDNASIAAILADTADLQANQGQWLTATGFNTVAPDNAGITANGAAISALNDLTASEVENAVWDATVSSHVVADSYGLRSVLALNSNRTIQITGSHHAAADVHEFQADSLTSAATDASFVTEVQSGLALQATSSLILADTSDLQSNQGQWLTATGFSTFDPASDTVAHVTLVDTTTDLTNGGGGGSCPTVQEIVDGWGNQPQNVYNTAGTLGYYLDAQVSTAGSGGTGLYQSTVRIEDASNNSLQGARVNVDGTTLTLTTGTSGEVTFNLDNGVYLLEVSPPAGYGTPVGQVLTVSGADPADTTFTLSDGCGTVPWIG